MNVGSVWWIHSARSSSEQAFAAEARELLSRLPGAALARALQPPALR